MPLRLRLGILLLLAPAAVRADDPQLRPQYAPDWHDALASEPMFKDALDLVDASDVRLLRTLLHLAARDHGALWHLTHLDDDRAARLIANLEQIDRADPRLRRNVLGFGRLLNLRRPEAVVLILRASLDADEVVRSSVEGVLDQPMRDPMLLRALADTAAAGDAELRAAALARLPAGDADVRAALASAIARAAALGRFGTAKSLLDDRYVDFRTLVRAFTVALNSSVGTTQRLRVLAAISEAELLSRVDASDPLVTTIARVSGQAPGRPGGENGARRLIAAAVVAINLHDGVVPAADALASFKSDATALRDVLTPGLESSADKAAKLAAMQTVQLLGAGAVAPYRSHLTALLTDPDHDVRFLAAQCLGDDRSLTIARVQDVLADCRADSPTLRETAARQLHELNIFPRPVTAALLRAVAARDMPAREGLLRALERTHAARTDPVLALRSAAAAAADGDPASRAYARAALRELAPARPDP